MYTVSQTSGQRVCNGRNKHGGTKTRSELALYVFLVVIAAFVILRTITSLWLPFGWDHGMMATTGHVYLEGGLPYRDAWDMKGPAAFFGFALAEIIFGRTMWGIRIIDAAIVMSAAVLLGKLIAKHATPRYGIAGALAFLLCIFSNGWFFTAQPEGWVAAASTFAIVPLLLADQDADWRHAALSGLPVALSGLIKPLYFLFGLVPLILLAVLKELTLAQRARLIAVLALSAALPVGLVLALFVAKGGFADLVEVHILYTTRSYADLGFASIARALWVQSIENLFHINTGGIIPILCLIPFIAVSLWSRRMPGTVFVGLVSWFCIALVCIALQGKFYTYHWLPLYPPAVALAVFGLADWLEYPYRPAAKTLASAVFTGAFLILAARTPAKETWWTGRYLAKILTSDEYYANFQFDQYNSKDDMQAIRYLRTHAKGGDGLFVWGREATINYLAGIRSPSRFIFSLPITKPGPFLSQYRSEALNVLEAKKPRFIIIGTPYFPRGRKTQIEEKTQFISLFPEFATILRTGYEYSTSFGYLDLYERRPVPH